MFVSTSGGGKWSAGAIEPLGPISSPKRVTPRRVKTTERSLTHAQTASVAFRFRNGGRVALYQRSGVGKLRSWISPQLFGNLRVELRSDVGLPLRVPSWLECTTVRAQLIEKEAD